jgi:hypothetical protein
LHTFCRHLTLSSHQKGYLTLEVKLGKSTKNKNAISILPNRVSFMVTDWSGEETARGLQISTRRSTKHRRLQFPELTVDQITQHKEFFESMVWRAFRESQMLQGYFHFAGNATDAKIMINGHIVEGIWLTRLNEAIQMGPRNYDEVFAEFIESRKMQAGLR